ncbi:MAG: putative lipid II flippase FtsW, partial [Chitinivibrionales bacterium]|nr:putative lipid II flippase FtsW [Chitinivibrionales bacterium]
ALLGFGVVLVYSSSFAIAQDRFGGSGFFLERQVVRVLIALVCFVVFINIDYHVWGRLSSLGFMSAVVLLVSVLLLPERYAINGAKRWLMAGGVRFQVSEFARLALIVLIASRCQDLGESIRDWRRFVQTAAKAGAICTLVVLEPDFSTAFVIGTIALAMLFMAGARFWHVSGVVLATLPVMAAGLLLTPYRRERLMSYLSTSERAETVGYQAQQALIGLGNGGLFGVGIGQGKQKYFYLPEPHTDFAFSILGEEIGFVGLLIVFAVFAFIIYRGFRIALNAPDMFGRLTAFGVTLVVASYALVHAAVNVGLVPTTGVPLPFLSYGGVSIVLTMISFGILLNISSQAVPSVEKVANTRRERLKRYRPGAKR